MAAAVQAAGSNWVGRPVLKTSRSPRQLPQERVDRILRVRRRLRQSSHRLAYALGVPRSTVYVVLRRRGVSRLRDSNRLTDVPVRYVRDHPGELLHIDTKQLGRIPPGGGHHVLSKSEAFSNSLRPGYEYIHVAVDDASRLAFVQVHPDQGTTPQQVFCSTPPLSLPTTGSASRES
jgi:hypothetical protein